MIEEFSPSAVQVCFREVKQDHPFDYGGMIYYKLGQMGYPLVFSGIYGLTRFEHQTPVLTHRNSIHHADYSSPTQQPHSGQASC